MTSRKAHEPGAEDLARMRDELAGGIEAVRELSRRKFLTGGAAALGGLALGSFAGLLAGTKKAFADTVKTGLFVFPRLQFAGVIGVYVYPRDPRFRTLFAVHGDAAPGISRSEDGHYLRYTECMERSGRLGKDGVREYLAKIERASPDARFGQELALKIARGYLDEGRYDEALEAYERVFVNHPAVSDFWYDAQCGIVEAHLGAGSPEEALRAARICLDAGKHGIGRNVRLVAEVMQKVDGDVRRANTFIDFQCHGPAGADGKTGTADDLQDPMESVGYPSCPERERAFARAREEAGDGVWGSRHRALTYIYTGRPEETLGCFIDAFRRAKDDDFHKTAEEMILTGVRGVRGHAAGLEPVFRFVAHGPAGPDGKRGTNDDVPDPVPLPARTVSALAEAQRAGHTERDIDALGRVGVFLQKVARDTALPGGERRETVWALRRVHEALGDWGEEPVLEWYVARTLEERDDGVQEALLTGFLAAARGGEHHLGGVHALWGRLDARLKKGQKQLMGGASHRRRRFGETVDRLAKRQWLAPKEGHLRPGEGRREKLVKSERGPVPEPRKPDVSPPTVPARLRVSTASYSWAMISWDAADDPESGLHIYEVFRNGEYVACAKETSFTDEGLAEDTTYAYTVAAVNGLGMASAPTAALSVTTPADRQRPKVVSAAAAGDAERVVLVFSEPVEKASAERTANYRIGPGVRVTSASLEKDLRTVTLKTSRLSKGVEYSLGASGVRDLAKTPNASDADGKVAFEFVDTGDGLSAVYFDERNLTGKTFERVDPEVKFDWNRGEPAPGIARTDFSVRWTGRIRPDHSETYTFCARTDDGVRLWVDGRLVVDAWQHRAPTDSNGRIDLEAGLMYDVKMEYFQGGGGASAELYWSSRSVKKGIIGRANLYSR